MKCAQCGKTHNRKRFCCIKCKDHFHNLHNPRGIYAHLAREDGAESEFRLGDLDDGEGQGWDAHKDY